MDVPRSFLLLLRTSAGAAVFALAAGLATAPAACAGRGGAPRATPTATPDGDPDDGSAQAQLKGARWGTFHSRRFDLSLGLPDGRTWKIDDHRTPWLRATHAPSGSTLIARTWLEREPVSREHCYERAREWDPGLSLPILPELTLAPPETQPSSSNGVSSSDTDIGKALRSNGIIEDRVRMVGNDLTVRVTTGVDAQASRTSAPHATGFVVAAASAVRKCIVVAFRTNSDDASELADRLALVSSRVVGSITIGSPLSPTRLPVSP